MTKAEQNMVVVRNRKALIDEIISMYHTTRISSVSAADHILTKPSVQKAFDRLATSGAVADDASYAEWQQKRGMLADTIDWAINEYEEFMKDDAYDAQAVLDRIARKLKDRRDLGLTALTPAGDAPAVEKSSPAAPEGWGPWLERIGATVCQRGSDIEIACETAEEANLVFERLCAPSPAALATSADAYGRALEELANNRAWFGALASDFARKALAAKEVG